MTFKEVPISCNYNIDGSTQGAVGHGLGVIVSILQYMEVEHSLLFFGVPGLILFIIGLFFGFYVYMTYITAKFIPFGSALITIGLLILGSLLGITGLILHAVITANRRLRGG